MNEDVDEFWSLSNRKDREYFPERIRTYKSNSNLTNSSPTGQSSLDNPQQPCHKSSSAGSQKANNLPTVEFK
jgi:hypothetical protein